VTRHVWSVPAQVVAFGGWSCAPVARRSNRMSIIRVVGAGKPHNGLPRRVAGLPCEPAGLRRPSRLTPAAADSTTDPDHTGCGRMLSPLSYSSRQPSRRMTAAGPRPDSAGRALGVTQDRRGVLAAGDWPQAGFRWQRPGRLAPSSTGTVCDVAGGTESAAEHRIDTAAGGPRRRPGSRPGYHRGPAGNRSS
jgi:hypothetical protein